jgi:hypothetical protein
VAEYVEQQRRLYEVVGVAKTAQNGVNVGRMSSRL